MIFIIHTYSIPYILRLQDRITHELVNEDSVSVSYHIFARYEIESRMIL